MIYFDYAATSLKRKEIFREIFNRWDAFDANPDSLHGYGRSSGKILEESRRQIAQSIQADPKQIIFTSGASESNNTILHLLRHQKILTTKIEHASILNAIKGYHLDPIYLELTKEGVFCQEDFRRIWSDKIQAVSFTMVNNELGNISPLAEVGAFLADKKCWYHIDAVQAYGHIPIDVQKLQCDSLSLSGHKVGGMSGFGILYVRDRISPLIYGGDQEKKRRGGTSFVAGAYTMAQAFDAAWKEREMILQLKQYFIRRLQEENIDFAINGSQDQSVAHILNLYFPFVKSNFLLMYLDMRGICVSSGSACSAGSLQPSHVITNVYGLDRAEHSVRFSFGFSNEIRDIDRCVGILKELYEKRKDEKASHCRN